MRQFSTPGGMPSHVSVPTPGSIHEGGELGYALVHAFGAAFDNPDLLVACVVGDGEAETGPARGLVEGRSRFLNPARDGAVLPILHLNGYKITGPTVLGRAATTTSARSSRGHGYEPCSSRVTSPCGAPSTSPGHSTRAYEDPRDPGRAAQRRRRRERPTGPRSCCARRRAGPGPRWSTACRSRGPSGPSGAAARVRENPEHLAMLEAWMRSYRPEELFDEDGRLVAGARDAAPEGDEADGRGPHANGGRLHRPARRPRPRRLRDRRSSARRRAATRSTRPLGEMVRDIFRATTRRRTSGSSVPTRRTRTGSARCSRSRTAA